MTATVNRVAIARAVAQIMFKTGCIQFNIQSPFLFPSGRLSPVYLDCRRIMSFPDERRRLMDLAADTLFPLGAEALAGAGPSASPFAAMLAERLDVPVINLHMKAAGNNTPRAVMEGSLPRPEARIVPVFDLYTLPGSKQPYLDTLRAAGADISDIFVLFDYGMAPCPPTAAARLHALTNWWDVLEVAHLSGYGDAATLASIRQYLKAPDAWVPPHGRAANATEGF
jgi:orotate phosphoribosyltransferase